MTFDLLMIGLLTLLTGGQGSSLPYQEVPETTPETTPETVEVRGGVADLLAAVPSDAALVFSVHDLASLDGKLTKVVQQLGLPPVSLYMLIKGELLIVEGLEDHGSAAVIVMPSEVGQAVEQRSSLPIESVPSGSIAQSMAMLLPTTDRTKLLTLLNPQPLKDDYVKVTLGGRESFVGTKGPFTVFGPNLRTVKAVIAAKSGMGSRLSSHQRKRFAANDVSTWVNPGSFHASPLAVVVPEKLKRLVGEGSNPLLGWKSVQASLRVEEGGIALEYCAERIEPTRGLEPTGGLATTGGLEPTGGLATNRTDGKQNGKAHLRPGLPPEAREETESLLHGLPEESFVLAMGFTGNMGRFVLSLAGAFGLIEPARLDELGNAVNKMAAETGDVSLSLAALPEGPEGLIGMAKVIRIKGDGSQVPDEINKLISVLKSGIFVDPRINAAMARLEHRPAAETSSGVTINHLVIDPGDSKVVDRDLLARAVGKEGLLLRVGVVDRKYVVASFGGGLARFDALVAGVRANRAPLSLDPAIRRSARNVAARRSLEGHFAVDRLVGLINAVCRAVDLPEAYPALPELSTPISWAMHSVGSRETQIDVFIPIEVVVALKDSEMQRAVAKTRVGSFSGR